jgi:hypothetical protein
MPTAVAIAGLAALCATCAAACSAQHRHYTDYSGWPGGAGPTKECGNEKGAYPIKVDNLGDIYTPDSTGYNHVRPIRCYDTVASALADGYHRGR